ncbi:LuxR C-terminal-related transcriptional regulator [Microbispora sp. NPDC049125]|uniref:helix-turn-helix transcriptional regulator n=1 Tax=Microbispora sp. NPDC049125 TaxID=3154929 RepID=UPI0034662FB9
MLAHHPHTAGPGRQRALHTHFLEVRRKAKGPVAVVDGRTMFVNSAAAGLLSSADRTLLWEWARRRLSTASGRQPGRLTLPSGTLTGRCEGVYDDHVLTGAVIWLAGRPAGAGPAWARLTDSERTVAEHVARGLTNRETAALLFISPHTVDYHLRQVFRKFQVRSRVELARLMATQAG